MIGSYLVLLVLVKAASCKPLSIESDISAINSQKYYEKGGFFEGDMRFPNGVSARNGMIGQQKRWTNNTVYYTIGPEFSTTQRNIITNGMNEIQANTCITFVPRTTQSNYVHVQGENSGCWSYVGMIQGKQLLNLQLNGCVYRRTVMHEFIHALGFFHQHSATNRDDYIEVILDNVLPEYQYAFDKLSANQITDFGVGYDYWSVMHYHQYAFSKNGQRTIKTLDPNVQTIIGTVDALSGKDIAKIKSMYKCT